MTKEIWKPIPGYEDLYSVSNLGRFRNERNGKIKEYNSLQYERVSLTKNGIQKTSSIHQLVALAFIGENPTNSVVNHKDGNKKNNRLDNLEYVTMGENTRHYHAKIKIPFKCVHCGIENNRAAENWKYCPYCGNPLR